jgi:hypothetical protein
MTTIRESLYRTVARTGCAVAFSAVLAVGLGAPSARAQTSHDHDRSAGGREYLNLSAAYNGYSDGFTRGAEDLKIGPDFKPQHDVTFLRAETGYTSDMGPLGDYQSAFRRAYSRGYADAHSGRERDPGMNLPPSPPEPGTPGGPGGSSLSVASAAGYDSGHAKGIEDRKSGVSYGYREDEIYRRATRGYYPSLGEETRYQMVFRQIYARGYSDGFNGRERYTDTEIAIQTDELVQALPSASRSETDAIPIDSRPSESGYRTGHERGAHDRQIGTTKPNPQGHGAYQFALDGWDSTLGDRSAYQQEYRTSFVRGYDDGFHGRESTLVSRPR